MDVRINKAEPFAQSEDQEDELLSIVGIKGLVPYVTFLYQLWIYLYVIYFRNSKFVVGTQLGILSIFNRNKGWGDCVDRIPG